MKKISGGQQICTQEYLKILKLAGFSLKIIEYEWDRKFLTRLKRHFFPLPYSSLLPSRLIDDIIEHVHETKATLIFLNVVDVAPIAKQLREKLDNQHKIILLSHGLASVDYLHEIRAKGGGKFFSRVGNFELQTLSRQLIAECEQRKYIDYVFCLAPFEVEIERWLGSKKTVWLPRTVSANRLNWQPNLNRLGFVGTVDHPPNGEGLILFLEALEKIVSPQIRLRLVGGPVNEATAIAKRFPIVEYLGQLTDTELEREASTWSCFVHPIFCYARGCSTKLAIAIGWQIPIATTPAGCRGYSWTQGNLPMPETPEELAKLAMKMVIPEFARSIQQEVVAIAKSAPTLAEVSSQVQAALFVPFSDD